MNDFPTINTGFLPSILPDGYFQGLLPYKVVLESADWRPFAPKGDPQAIPQPNPIFDCKGCVSFSNNNVAETLLKFQGFDFKFSNRALSKLSGTTQVGNDFQTVEFTNVKNGRILDINWPAPDNPNWNVYYAEIPDAVKRTAIYFHEDWEFISTDVATLQYHLKQCPIQIAIPTPHPNHGVCLLYIQGNTAYYLDSYPGADGTYMKTMDVSLVEAAMKLIIKPVIMAQRYIVQDNNFSPAKIGVLVLEGFTGTATFADNPPHLQNLKDALGFVGTEPTVQIPKQTI